MTNALDEEVPLVYDAANWSYDPKHHDLQVRMIYVGLKYLIKQLNQLLINKSPALLGFFVYRV